MSRFPFASSAQLSFCVLPLLSLGCGDSASKAPDPVLTPNTPASVAPVETSTPVATLSAPPEMPSAAPPMTPSEDIVVDLPGDEAPATPEADAGEPEETVMRMVTEQCANTEVSSVDITSVQPADIIFVIDTSGSMGTETDFVQANMNAFSQQIIDSGIDVHVILIANPLPEEMADTPAPAAAPSASSTAMPAASAPAASTGGGFGGGGFGGGGFMFQQYGICIDAPLGSGSCPADENLPIYRHVTQNVRSHDALNLVINTFPQWQDQLRPEASKSFVVVSDDDATEAPNNNADAFTTALQGLSADLFTSFSFNGIFCGRDCAPDSAAIGAVYQALVAKTEGVSGELCDQDFQPVFDRLAKQIIEQAGTQIACEWELPSPPEGQTFSTDLVEVSRTTDTGGTTAFQQVNSEAECGPTSWYFDDPLNPTRVLACPDTCAAMQAEGSGRIDVSFSCELIGGCAASSASAVTDSDVGQTCAFPLPAPPSGVDLNVDTINVRYETPSGFGVVLGVVPSADECANVTGGWYFDDPKKPTSVHLCPNTCDQYNAGTVTNVQAIFGCESKPALGRAR
ncbi:MAG TPA: hypothetical protein VHM70_30885 [Polyangiaceae bacterium]|nr:hypothetical protein [Polyangiaceae bacterium]